MSEACRRTQTSVAARRTTRPRALAPSRSCATARGLAHRDRRRQRAECMAHIQTDAVQLALDLLVREPDIAGFFRGFIKTPGRGMREPRLRRLADRRGRRRATCGWPYIQGEPFYAREQPGLGSAGAAAREHGGAPARLHRGLDRDHRYARRRSRGCRRRCARSTARTASTSMLVAPLALPTAQPRLGRAVDRRDVGRASAVAARAARRHGAAGDAGAASQPARRAEPARRAPPGGARGTQPHRARHPRHAGAGLRGDPDAAAGGAARRAGEPAAGGRAQPRHGGRSRAHAHDRSAPLGRRAAAAVDGAGGRRAPRCSGMADLAQRTAEPAGGARRSTRCRRSAPASSARSSASPRRRSPTPCATRARRRITVHAGARPRRRLPAVGGRRRARHCRANAATPASA